MPDSMTANLAADLCQIQAEAWRLVAKYLDAGIPVPPRLSVFVGRPRSTAPTTASGRTRAGAKPKVLAAILTWFRERRNEPATYQEIAAETGLSLAQVRTCVTRNEAEAFERVGGRREGDKLRAVVRLSEAGLKREA